MLTYLIGMTRAGKTTFSKMTAERYQLYYFKFDEHWNYEKTVDEQWEKFAAVVQSAIDNHGDIIIDGMLGLALQKLHERFPDAKPLIIYTDVDIIKTRATPENIWGWTVESLNNAMMSYYRSTVDHDPSFILGGNGDFTRLSPLAMFSYLGEPWTSNMEQWLIDHVDSFKCDSKYSPLKIGSTIRPGYERALESLDKIKGLVDWNGAQVLEYGPHLAYEALHFYGDLANHVQLVECSSTVCQCISKMTNYLGKWNIEVINQNMMSYKAFSPPDIVLCMNMFYNVADKRAGALKLWDENPSHIIVETNEEDFKFLDEVAKEKGYKKNTYQGRTNCSGHNRMIGHYTQK